MPNLFSVSLLALSISSISSCLAQSPLMRRGTASLSDEISSCAQCCVYDFINSQYPHGACSDLTDLDCLCRTNTTSGFTLGEAALRCTLAYCPQDVISASKALYICDSVSGALPITHGTITATIITTKTISITPTPSSRSCPLPTASTTPSAANTTSFASSSRASSTSFTISTTTPTFNSRSSTTSAASAASAATSSSTNPSRLSTPAVVGISVASGVAGLALIGLLLFFCIRKTKQRRRNSDGFEIGGAMTEPPEFMYASTRNPSLGPGPHPRPGGAHERPQPQLGSPFQPVSHGPMVVVTTPSINSMAAKQPQAPGLATSPDTEHGDSPMSQASRRTLSQLLPDKPDYTLDPERSNMHQNGTRPESSATVFEEDVERSRRLSSLPTVAGSAPRNRYSSAMPFHPDSIRRHAMGAPADPRTMMYAKERELNGLPTVRRVSQRNPLVYRTASQLRPAGDTISQGQAGSSIQRHVSRTGSIYADNQRRGSRRASRPPSGTGSSRRCSECSETSFEDDEVPSSSNLTVSKQLTPVEEMASPFTTPEKKKNSPKSPTAASPPKQYASDRRDASSAEQIATLDSIRSVRRDQSAVPGQEWSGSQSRSRTMNLSSDFTVQPGSELWTDGSGVNRGLWVSNTDSNPGSQSRVANTSPRMQSNSRMQNFPRPDRTPPMPANLQANRTSQGMRNLTPSRRGPHLILRVDSV